MEGPENPDEKDGAAFSLLESLIYSSPPAVIKIAYRRIMPSIDTQTAALSFFVGVYNFLMIYIVFFGVIAIKHLQFVK